MRIFIALDIDQDIRERIARFQQGVRNFAPDAKWVGTETFHITLKFVGETSPKDVDSIRDQLRNVHCPPCEIGFRGCGFFPNARSPRVFWVGIQADERLRELASAVDTATAKVGIPREEHEFSPHLTLARARGASGSPRAHGTRSHGTNSPFAHLHEKLQLLPEPEFGTMTATGFFLYESRLSPKGAQYAKLTRFELGDPGEHGTHDKR